MNNTISVSQNVQHVAPNSGSSAKRSGDNEGKFSEHFSGTTDEKVSSQLSENRKNIQETDLPRGDAPIVDAASQGIAVVDAEVPQYAVKITKMPEIGIRNIPSDDVAGDVVDDIEVQTKNDDTQPVVVKPDESEAELQVENSKVGEKPAVPQSVPVAVAAADVGNNVSASKSQSEMASSRSLPPQAMAGRARVVTGRPENAEAAQDGAIKPDQINADGEEGRNAVRPARTMPEHMHKKVGDHRFTQEKGTNGEVNPNNVTGKADRPTNVSAAQNGFGARGIEGRLASMMTEASGAFEGDVKITMTKPEGHALPAMPQQLTVGGMSRTVVSQVLEMRQSNEAGTNALDAKPSAVRPDKVIEVQLMPRNLGTVGITIRNVAGRITIAIEVQGAEAERLIKTEVDKIAGAIRQAGQVVEDISVKRGVQMSQQSDSLTGDHQSGRQDEANFGRNSGNSMWQSSRDESNEASNSRDFGNVGIEENSELAVSSQKENRQGVYL